MRGEGVGRRRSKEHDIKKDSKKHHVNEVSENQDAKKDSRKHYVKKKPKRDYKESKHHKSKKAKKTDQEKQEKKFAIPVNAGTCYNVVRNPKLTRENVHNLSGIIEKFSDYQLVGGEDDTGKDTLICFTIK